jgi:hypothetical protein
MVKDLDTQIGRIRPLANGAGTSLPTRALAPPSAPIVDVPLASPPSELPSSAALRAVIAAAAPTPEEIRAEFEKEALGESKLFARGLHRRFGAREAEELQSAEDDLANERFAILHRYENQILNLQIKEHVLAHLAAGFRTGSYSTSNTKKFYGQVTGQLASVRSALDAAQQQQTRDLLENNGEDQAAMARIRAEIATQIAAQIREHDQDVRRQIDERVAEVIQDLAQDAAERRRLLTRPFVNPLKGSFTVGNPTLPVNPATIPSLNSRKVRAAAANQLAALEKQRQQLSGTLIQDTRSWVEAIARRRKLAVVFRPQVGWIDGTGLFAGWIRRKAIPPAWLENPNVQNTKDDP